MATQRCSWVRVRSPAAYAASRRAERTTERRNDHDTCTLRLAAYMSGGEAEGGPGAGEARAQPLPDLPGSESVEIVCFKCKGSGTCYLKSRKRPRGHRGGAGDAGGANQAEPSAADRGGGEGDGEERGPAPKAGAVPVPGNARLWTAPCGVCGGSGRMRPRKSAVRQMSGEIGGESVVHRDIGVVAVRPCKAPPGWDPPGPAPFAETATGKTWHRYHTWAEGKAGEGEGAARAAATELCMLCGRWRIYQPVRGHRYSTDDVVTAWFAARAFGALVSGDGPRHCLDLGCGIGSVLLMLAWRWPGARCLGVEAQRERHALASASAAYNTGARRLPCMPCSLLTRLLPLCRPSRGPCAGCVR